MCCIAVTVLAIGPPGELDATILTFDQTREAGVVIPTISGRDVPQDYGDRVTGSPMTVSGGQFTYGAGGEGFTPNVVVEYFSGSASPIGPGVSLWADQYGDLVNVLFGNQNSSMLSIQLTADAGFSVQLYHFDLGGWPNTDYTINAVRVLDGGATLFEQGDVLVEGDLAGPGHTSFDFAAPLSGRSCSSRSTTAISPAASKTTSASTTCASDRVRHQSTRRPSPGPRRPCCSASRWPACCSMPAAAPALGRPEHDRERGPQRHAPPPLLVTAR